MAEARGAAPAPAVTAVSGAASLLRDTPEHWPVTQCAELARGRLLRVRVDTVTMPDGTHADRELTEHPGAVAILALDEADRVLLIRQYRHPAGALLWEIPAGLRDVTGEPLLAAAQRELLEETGYRAADWRVLTDFFTSPGSSTERVRVFLARGLTEVPAAERDYAPEYEEASLQVAWLPLEEAARGFLAGHLHNGVAAVGILSAYAAIKIGFGGLRETGAPEIL
ncbi:MAG TPA: NUDIX hydrolase [Streptosporangiaceae bacterium]|nr:NUDIX hydrolase [Streptosporangiaceae bacterium]